MGNADTTPTEIVVSLDDLETLRTRIEQIAAKQHAEDDGIKGAIKLWGGVLGILAALFALPKGCYDSYQIANDAMAGADVMIHATGTPMQLFYEPSPPQMKVRTPIILENQGKRTDIVTTVVGYLDDADHEIGPVLYFPVTSTAFNEDSRPLQLPISLQPGQVKTLNFTVHSPIPAPLLNTFRNSHEWRLTLEFTGASKRTYTHVLCFEMGKALAQKTFSRADSLTFVSSSC